MYLDHSNLELFPKFEEKVHFLFQIQEFNPKRLRKSSFVNFCHRVRVLFNYLQQRQRTVHWHKDLSQEDLKNECHRIITFSIFLKE